MSSREKIKLRLKLTEARVKVNTSWVTQGVLGFQFEVSPRGSCIGSSSSLDSTVLGGSGIFRMWTLADKDSSLWADL